VTLAEEVAGLVAAQARCAAGPSGAEDLAGHMLAHLLREGRHCVTGLLRELGREDRDWTRPYGVYRDMDPAALFRPVIEGVLGRLGAGEDLVLIVDDTCVKKTGPRVHGAGWYRDAQGPGFHTNLMWGQRVLQISAAVPDPARPRQAVGIPVAMALIPKLPKPPADASDEALAEHRRLAEDNTPARHAGRLLRAIRDLPCLRGRRVRLTADGEYSNGPMLGSLPPATVYVGRARWDLHLHALPPAPPAGRAGRPPAYGPRLPTPEELRKDRGVPWTEVNLRGARRSVRVRYKRMEAVRWPALGAGHTVQILVLAGFRYRPRKGAPYRYREPVCLICTDPRLSPGMVIRTYLCRWAIEVNFRDQKQFLGMGHAQVRRPGSVLAAPAAAVAAYAALLLAGLRVYGVGGRPPSARPPKWYPRKAAMRATTSDLLEQFRAEVRRRGAGDLTGFVGTEGTARPPVNPSAAHQAA